jgi:hypothetical protein
MISLPADMETTVDSSDTYNICNILLSLNSQKETPNAPPLLKTETPSVKIIEIVPPERRKRSYECSVTHTPSDVAYKRHDKEKALGKYLEAERDYLERREFEIRMSSGNNSSTTQQNLSLLAMAQPDLNIHRDLTIEDAQRILAEKKLNGGIVERKIEIRVDGRVETRVECIKSEDVKAAERWIVNEAERRYQAKRTEVEIERKARLKQLAENPLRKRGRFMWPDSLHKKFIGAIFDIGLSHVNREVVSEMMQRNREVHQNPLLHPVAINLHMLCMHEFRMQFRETKAIAIVPVARMERLQDIGHTVANYIDKMRFFRSNTIPSTFIPSDAVLFTTEGDTNITFDDVSEQDLMMSPVCDMVPEVQMSVTDHVATLPVKEDNVDDKK